MGQAQRPVYRARNGRERDERDQEFEQQERPLFLGKRIGSVPQRKLIIVANECERQPGRNGRKLTIGNGAKTVIKRYTGSR